MSEFRTVCGRCAEHAADHFGDADVKGTCEACGFDPRDLLVFVTDAGLGQIQSKLKELSDAEDR